MINQQYFVVEESTGRQQGPYKSKKIKELIKENQVSRGTPARRVTTIKWTNAGRLFGHIFVELKTENALRTAELKKQDGLRRRKGPSPEEQFNGRHTVRCSCGKEYRIRQELLGKKLQCNKCNSVFRPKFPISNACPDASTEIPDLQKARSAIPPAIPPVDIMPVMNANQKESQVTHQSLSSAVQAISILFLVSVVLIAPIVFLVNENTNIFLQPDDVPISEVRRILSSKLGANYRILRTHRGTYEIPQYSSAIEALFERSRPDYKPKTEGSIWFHNTMRGKRYLWAQIDLPFGTRSDYFFNDNGKVKSQIGYDIFDLKLPSSFDNPFD